MLVRVEQACLVGTWRISLSTSARGLALTAPVGRIWTRDHEGPLVFRRLSRVSCWSPAANIPSISSLAQVLCSCAPMPEWHRRCLDRHLRYASTLHSHRTRPPGTERDSRRRLLRRADGASPRELPDLRRRAAPVPRRDSRL